MSTLDNVTKELLFLVFQFLAEENLTEPLHRLERESGIYFNMKYFEERVLNADWVEVENYLSSFTKFDDNPNSTKIYFEIRKHKYLEALDRQDRHNAVEILAKDLKVFEELNQETYKQLTFLLTLQNFRENEILSIYGDMIEARREVMSVLKQLIKVNPILKDKLTFPTMRRGRLMSLMHQSFSFQHLLCRTPMQNVEVTSLMTDHVCLPQSTNPRPAPQVPVRAPVYDPSHSLPPLASILTLALPQNIPSTSNMGGALDHNNDNASLPVASNQEGIKRSAMSIGDDLRQGTEFGQHSKRHRSGQASSERFLSPDDLPRTVVWSLNQGAAITSLDFHPSAHTILLAGSADGVMTVWEVRTREKLVSEPLQIWDKSACSTEFQASMENGVVMSVNHVLWSQDGCFLAAAFSRHLVHVYAFKSPVDIRHHVEIDAHVGQVNNLAFVLPNNQLCIITCGDDKLIKMWDISGGKLFQFEGHEAPVYSLCYHPKLNAKSGPQQFIFSTSVDGRIKVWLFDLTGPKANYDIQGLWFSTMICSIDEHRLFYCGSNKDGKSFLVEWNEKEGSVKKSYRGLRRKSLDLVHFDIAKTQLIAAGEENQIKFWGWDDVNLLSVIDADGGLPNFPRLKFNKEGNILAVGSTDNGIKILASATGLTLLGVNQNPAVVVEVEVEPLKASLSSPLPVVSHERAELNSQAGSASLPTGVNPPPVPIESISNVPTEVGATSIAETEAEMETERSIVPQQISEPDQCLIVSMPKSNNDSSTKIVKVMYAHGGDGVLALTTSGTHKFWKWEKDEMMGNVVPRLCQPDIEVCTRNDASMENLEGAVPCLDITKNDFYMLSAFGGNVGLFDMSTMKMMMTLRTSPPVSTFVCFHPQDNSVIAFGMEDSVIHIYHARLEEVSLQLLGHENPVTGITFSCALNLMVSSGADAQVLFWNSDKWEKENSLFLELPDGKEPPRSGGTTVQFHTDQILVLVSHESQLAIYDCSTMTRVVQWVPQGELPSPISLATYSCDGMMVYATFRDACIGIFDSNDLTIMCRIAPKACMGRPIMDRNEGEENEDDSISALAAHPHYPDQFAVALSDGSVKIIEPKLPRLKWADQYITEE